ncbi:Berberine bridge enzyme-like 21, partial [Bienertia sinuspersici]
NFIHCFIKNTNPHDDLSHIVYTTSNSSYASILQTYIKNLRFNTLKTRKLEYIITPLQKSHVSSAVLCTKSCGLSLRIRSGGHDFEGLSYISDIPFVIFNMFNLRAIHVNIDKQTAYVEVGAIVGELYYRIWEKSKVHGFPAEICPTVCIRGHISGGGYGNMIRKYGLSVDHIVNAELVDVNGRILDKSSMGEDLFWAIKGGGGANFGVVLSYILDLVYVPERVTVFRVMRFAEDNVTKLVYKWEHIMEDIDENLFIRLVLQPVMPEHNSPTVVRVTFISLFLGGVEKLISLMNSEFLELGLQKSDCLEMSWAQSVLFWSNYENETAMNVLLNRTYNAYE